MAKDNIPKDAISVAARRKQLAKDLALLEKSVAAVAKTYSKRKVAPTLTKTFQQVDHMQNRLKRINKKDVKGISAIEADLYSLAFRMRSIFPDPGLGSSFSIKQRNGAQGLSKKELKQLTNAHRQIANLVHRYEGVGRSVGNSAHLGKHH